VGLLSSAFFSPRLVDDTSVRLAGAPAVPVGKNGLGRFSELNRDGELDLVLWFRPAEMRLGTGETRVVLEGATLGGDRIRGEAGVRVFAP
jgi:hypothetical protein